MRWLQAFDIFHGTVLFVVKGLTASDNYFVHDCKNSEGWIPSYCGYKSFK